LPQIHRLGRRAGGGACHRFTDLEEYQEEEIATDSQIRRNKRRKSLPQIHKLGGISGRGG
jgi:hypothetical protein